MRLGLLSTARIHSKVLPGLSEADGVELVAVGGRSRERAEAHAREHGIPRAHGSYEALLADPEVDAVYIALPNALHAEWAERALDAGKHVLVEKPFTTDPAVAERVFDKAAERKLALMEGFMWRHGAQAARMEELVKGGAIGELRLVISWFSFNLQREGDARLDPELGGGALLDVGSYCVNASRLLAGEPEAATGVAARGPTGVDVRFAGTMRHPGGVLSLFDCGIDMPERAGVEALGSEGTLRLLDPFHGIAPVIEIERDGNVEREEIANTNQYGRELADLARAARDGGDTLLGRDDAVGQARALRMLIEAAA
jgi:predicted dehydrogenase